MSRKTTVYIIQGAQWGSEGKGAVAAEYVKRKDICVAVRTGSANAGHTVMYFTELDNYVPVVMRHIPTAWVVPGVQLVIGAGSIIDPHILQDEINTIKNLTGEDVRERLIVDDRAFALEPCDKSRSIESGRHAHMGGTGKGSSEAFIRKIQTRGFEDWETSLLRHHMPDLCYVNTARHLAHMAESHDILLEGTQGTLLDLATGPYPFTTSRMCTPAAWLAECGLGIHYNTKVILVTRSHPIRVAGPSGPMDHEMSWVELGHKFCSSCPESMADQFPKGAVDLFGAMLHVMARETFPDAYAELGDFWDTWDQSQVPTGLLEKHKRAISDVPTLALHAMKEEEQKQLWFIEKTSVTQKIRRIARFSSSLFDKAFSIAVGPPHRTDPDKYEIVYGFYNYDFPGYWNFTRDDLDPILNRSPALEYLMSNYKVPEYITTGPMPEHMIEMDQDFHHSLRPAPAPEPAPVPAL